MATTIRMNLAVSHIVAAKIEKHGVPKSIFLEWKKYAESEISASNTTKVRCGSLMCREFRVQLRSDTRLFEIGFQIDWDASTRCAELVGFYLFPVPPVLAKSPDPDNPN